MNELRSMKTIDLMTIKELPTLRILAVRSEPVSPCLNNKPDLTRRRKVIQKINDNLDVQKGRLYELEIPKDLFTDEVRVFLHHITKLISLHP